MRARSLLPALLPAVLLSLALASTAGAKDYVLFEGGPVRPMALSPTGANLYVANAPDNRLEIFAVRGNGKLRHTASVPVGMEPVAVAAPAIGEVWVVNHLSDSVSIVNTFADPPRVERTLLVGDEPRDIVFGGTGNSRAFITTAHRGQHRTHGSIAGVPGAGDPQLTTAGVSRSDVWVFDASNLGATLGGTPVEILSFFGDTPRALTVSADGSTVYAAVFHSGNQTTTVSEGVVCDGFAGAGACSGDGIQSPGGLAGGNLPGGNPGPSDNHQAVTAPEVGLIVQWDPADQTFEDELGRNWGNGVRFTLPDHDVFAFDANSLIQTGEYDHVGTILYNMAVNPANGKVYATNGDSQNLTRFEGPGSHGGTTVQGNLQQYRISVLSGASTVVPRHLNSHINYATTPAPPGTEDHSLATPLDMAFTSDGSTVYVAAFGSSRVGVVPTAALEAGTFDPTVESANYIDVSGGGPAGLVLNEAQNRLYVYCRFSNSVSLVNIVTGSEIGSYPIADPEPDHVVAGRHMLYDAAKTSSNGEASCASCHVFGDLDSLAWDLGDPDADVSNNPIPLTIAPPQNVNGGAADDEFHPMKGPMTTQTLRGLANSGGMHWRGDRVDGFFGLDDPYVVGGDPGDEALSFNNFIVAFEGLVGGDTPPTDPQLQSDMFQFTAFALEMTLPPNPVRGLDNGLSAQAQDGESFYLNQNVDTQTCNGCHTLDPSQGFFGTGGLASFEGETQLVKIPHLRNMYAKVGMFGKPDDGFHNPGDNNHKGDQVRGFGFLHDGTDDTMFRFFQATVFSLFPPLIGFDNDGQRRDVEAFMLEFPSDLAPIVGQQVTDDGSGIGDVATRIGLMRARAGTSFTSKVLGGVVTECDLVVKGLVAGEERGYLYDPVGDHYEPDRQAEPVLLQADLDAIAAVAGQILTYTCAPPGSGDRMALDRDLDGVFDTDEIDQGTDPSNPGHLVGACNDGIDNDGDGDTDLADASCFSAANDNESPECADGVDNDGDGDVDLADAHCAGTADNREQKQGGGCGLGFELVVLLPVFGSLRRLRRRA